MKALNLNEIYLFLLDMDGTFYIGDKLVTGALDFLHVVRKQKKRVMFLTNNSSKNNFDYVEKLKKLGVDVTPEDIFTSGEATALFLEERFGHVDLFTIGTESLVKTLESYGHKNTEQNPQLVVLGYDTEINYRKLSLGCLFLRKGLKYIATHLDVNCPSLHGPVPDAGSFMALIEKSTLRKPDYIVGKPNPLMLKMIVRKTGVSPDKIAMVGDRLYTDMEFAYNSGVFSILVLSGETTLHDLKSVARKPDLIVENIGQLAKMIESGYHV
ncbi:MULTISPECIES: HAD-IIA family hydrolase [Pseudothermotoga]|uniref:HAD-IIA family hydrolase n=1 Tax=Pseudothermotoga TaxID=1643951 RepID=UPI000AFBA3A1|nr:MULTISPECIES: HAD-IIA family hydrolase [Pseudothermotoga]HBJ81899.1 HAD family hydrolase [Pseudothermotoga sp.]HBT26205.1 HAD family hydrolase [Pseudothermotoga sp.]